MHNKKKKQKKTKKKETKNKEAPLFRQFSPKTKKKIAPAIHLGYNDVTAIATCGGWSVSACTMCLMYTIYFFLLNMYFLFTCIIAKTSMK